MAVDSYLAQTLAATGGGPATGDAGWLSPGALVDRYVVLSRLGTGGMGIVYAAYDPELDRKVALKLLLPVRGGNAASHRRLQREAQTLAKLSHPNVVAVHDVGVFDGRVYVAMEFIEGQTVTRWLAQHEPSWRDVVEVFVQAGRGLAAAHAEGVLHRDVKPDNLMIDARGRVRVMDFGLARIVETAPSETPDQDGGTGGREPVGTVLQTRLGAMLGTPRYMAPEQFRGATVDARTDQFGLCVGMWEALYGERPFAGDAIAELCTAVVLGKRRAPPSGRKVPAWLRRVVGRGLCVEPDDRWPTMHALVTELSRDRSRRRFWWLSAGVGMAAAVGGVSVAAWQDAQLCSRAPEALAEVWDAQRREVVRSGLLHTDAPFAPGVWERAAPRLDAWGEAWAAMHTESCEATRRTGEQSEEVMDLRMACLYRARQEFDATVSVLSEATPQVLERVHELVADLPSLARCADIGMLRADVSPPDPAVAEAVDALRARLARATALGDAGELDAAWAALLPVEVAVEDLPYEPLVTEVALERGRLQEARGEYADAEQALRRAQRVGGRWNQREAVRDATVQLVSVLGHRQQRFSEAFALRDLAEGLAADSAVATASLQNSLGLALDQQGRQEEAAAAFRAALKLRVEALGPGHPDVAESHNNLAAALQELGRHEEAGRELRAALDVWLKTLGPDHPATATARNNLAGNLWMQGDVDEAARELRASLSIRLKTLGPNHPLVAESRNNLAGISYVRGAYAEAEAEHRSVLQQRLETLRPSHPDIAASRNNLAAALIKQGKHEEAAREARAAVAIWSQTLGPDHRHVTSARKHLVLALHGQGRYTEADAEQRALLRR